MLIPWRVSDTTADTTRVFCPNHHRQVLLFLLAFTVFLQPFGSSLAQLVLMNKEASSFHIFFSEKAGLVTSPIAHLLLKLFFVSFAIISTIQST